MKREMTRKERIIYDCILKCREENGYSPSMREIADIVGLHSASTVCRHIHSLEEKGWILTNDGRSHAIVPVKE